MSTPAINPNFASEPDSNLICRVVSRELIMKSNFNYFSPFIYSVYSEHTFFETFKDKVLIANICE